MIIFDYFCICRYDVKSKSKDNGNQRNHKESDRDPEERES